MIPHKIKGLNNKINHSAEVLNNFSRLIKEPKFILNNYKERLKIIDQTHKCVSGRTALLVIDMQRGFIDKGASDKLF